MKVKEINNIVIITPSGESCDELVEKINAEPKQFKDKNLIIDLTTNPAPDVAAYYSLNQKQMSQKKSFVLIVNKENMIDHYDLIIVPTLQEAQDIIEMEKIERDLGF